MTQRHDTLVPGLTLDFPVQAVAATCVGDGLVDDMPAVSTAVARVVAPIRVIENRCDSHARAESSQSFRFFAQVDLGAGDVHQYTIMPTLEEQLQMRARFEAGCAALGDTGLVGQDDD